MWFQQFLGYIGLILWSIQLLPQVYHSYHRKSTEGFSPGMMSIWYFAAILYFDYTLLAELQLAIILQPLIFCFFTLLCVLQYFYYDKHWALLKTAYLGITILISSTVLLVALYFSVQAFSNPTRTTLLFILGLVPNILTALAYLPQIYELWKTRNPYGISLTFLLLDMGGALSFLLSLLFFPPVDWLAAALYIIVLLFNSSICISCFSWRLLIARSPREDDALESGALEIKSSSKVVL